MTAPSLLVPPQPKIAKGPVTRLEVDPKTAIFLEEGFSSWSTPAPYAYWQRPHRETDEKVRYRKNRPEWLQHPNAFHGEGLLAIEESKGGAVHIFAAKPRLNHVPVVQAHVRGKNVAVVSEPGIEYFVDSGRDGLHGALQRWAYSYARGMNVKPLKPVRTVWNSWLQHFDKVEDRNVLENLRTINKRKFRIGVVQIDDGYQVHWGDWLETKPGFMSLEQLSLRIQEGGKTPGIWIAPFHVKTDSRLAREHRDWMLPVMDHSHADSRYILDITHPDAADHLTGVLKQMKAWGFDYFKADFLYAGAIESDRHVPMTGIEAYKLGMRIIREAIGDDSYLVGCGAPLLPSVGFVDAMRVGSDTFHEEDVKQGHVIRTLDASRPSPTRTCATRRWMNGYLWVNDTDSVTLRPSVLTRDLVADVARKHSGLISVSDRLADLDAHGEEVLRELLETGTNMPFAPTDLHVAAFGRDLRSGVTELVRNFG